MSAIKPNPALEDIQPRHPTALSAVFRRIASEPAASPPVADDPQLQGFAEPVEEAPRVEIFIPPIEEFAALHAEAPTVVAFAELERVEFFLEDEPPAEPEPEPPVREPPSSPPPQTQSLVGRLGRRLGDISTKPRAVPPPAGDPPQRPAPLVRRNLPPSPAPPPPRPAEPARNAVAPSPTPAIDRAGRPSLPRNRRLYRRVKLPAEMEIDGVPCTLIDLSIGGFAATGVPAVEANAVVPVTIRLVIDGIEVGTQLNARIIYANQARSSGRFIELTASQTAFLRYVVTWRGESVGAVGTTTLLDAIAGGSERGFPPGSPDRFEASSKSRWWAGLIGRKG